MTLALWTVQHPALYRALRQERLAPALFGSALSLSGLTPLAAGAPPHVVTAPLSDLYAEAVLLLNPESVAAVVGVLALILFYVAVGGRVYGLSRGGQEGKPGGRAWPRARTLPKSPKGFANTPIGLVASPNPP